MTGFIIIYCICEMLWISGFCAFMVSKKDSRGPYWEYDSWSVNAFLIFVSGIICLPLTLLCIPLYHIFLLIFNKNKKR